MADEAGSAPQLPVTYQDLDFAGDTLPTAIIQGDGVLLPIRRICQVLGLDPREQLRRIRAHDVLLLGLREIRMPFEGQLRVVYAIHQRYLAFWLATIVPSEVEETMRAKLRQYQEELVDLLNTLYSPDLSTNLPAPADPTVAELTRQMSALLIELRVTRETIRAQQQATSEKQDHVAELSGIVDTLQQQMGVYVPIAPAQQEFIARSIRGLAKRYERKTGKEIFAQLFAEFTKTMRTPSYDKLPAKQYDEAVAWIQRKAMQLFPDEPDAIPPAQQSLL